jgi:hypothetical protein
MKNTAKLLDQANALKIAGYLVDVKIFVVLYDLFFMGTYMRYERAKKDFGFGRFVYDAPLKESYENQIKTVEALKRQGTVDNLELYTRDKLLFSGDYKTADLVGIMKTEQCRKFTDVEVAQLKGEWKEIRQLMTERGAHEREFLRIDKQMKERISSCLKEQYQQENINLLINIKKRF